jgi:hypothetical protein
MNEMPQEPGAYATGPARAYVPPEQPLYKLLTQPGVIDGLRNLMGASGTVNIAPNRVPLEQLLKE